MRSMHCTWSTKLHSASYPPCALMVTGTATTFFALICADASLGKVAAAAVPKLTLWMVVPELVAAPSSDAMNADWS